MILLLKPVLFLLLAFNGEIDAKYLKKELEKYYHVKCMVKKEQNITSKAYDSNYHRYNAGKILDYQQKNYPDYFTIAVTSRDIGINKQSSRSGANWGILGYSIVGEQVAVMSVYRTKHNRQRTVKNLAMDWGLITAIVVNPVL